MAAKDVVVLNTSVPRLETPQVGDTTNFPEPVTMESTISVTGNGTVDGSLEVKGGLTANGIAVGSIDSGTATSVGALAINDTGRVWNTNVFQTGAVVQYLTSGKSTTGDIDSNTATQLVLAAGSSAPDSGTTYSIYGTGAGATTDTVLNNGLIDAVSVTIATTNVIDYVIYDTSKDSDGGQKITGGNIASSIGNIPTKTLLTISATTLDMRDMGDPTLPSLRSWTIAGGTSVDVVNGQIVYGGTGGLYVIDMIKDEVLRYDATNLSRADQNASNYNQGTATFTAVATTPIVNATVNAVAITYLDSAPIDSVTGLSVQTDVVSTATGGSWIKDDNTTIDATGVVNLISADIDSAGRTLFASTSKVYIYNSIPTADIALTSADYTFDTAGTSGPHIDGTIDSARWFNNDIVVGTSSGLFRIRYNEQIPANSIVSKTTSTYSTGGKIGDVRRSIGYDSTSTLIDSSVKSGSPTETGTLTKTTLSGGRTTVSGFSSANYISEPSHADFNAFGTGDFSFIFSGVNFGTSTTNRTLFSMGDGVSVGSIFFAIESSNYLRLYRHDGTSFVSILYGNTVAFSDNNEHVVELSRTNSTVSVFVDGKLIVSTGFSASISNATGSLVIGDRQDSTQAWSGGSFSGFLKISATSPTIESSEYIARTENAISGATSLLSANAVTSLSPNSDAGIIGVQTSSSYDYMHNLEVVNKGVALTDTTDLGFERVQINGVTDVRVASPARRLLDELDSISQAQTAVYVPVTASMNTYGSTSNTFSTANAVPVATEGVVLLEMDITPSKAGVSFEYAAWLTMNQCSIAGTTARISLFMSDDGGSTFTYVDNALKSSNGILRMGMHISSRIIQALSGNTHRFRLTFAPHQGTGYYNGVISGSHSNDSTAGITIKEI